MLVRTLSLITLSVAAWGQLQVVTTGLQGPHKLILSPAGNMIVSESNLQPNLGRVSIISKAGVRKSLLEQLPSGTEVAGGGSGPTALALREQTLFVALGGGDSERRGTAPGTSIHNPEGASSPLFTSILMFRFNQGIDSLNGPFKMTAEMQRVLTDGKEVTISDGAGGEARVSLLARFPVSEPESGLIYRFSNLWGLALTPDGRSLYVTDGSMNSLARVEIATGRWQRLVRFPSLQNPTPVGPPRVDSVPTSVRIYGNQVLVSFLSGFPFASGLARVLAVNPEEGTAEPFIFGLTSATDILWRPRADGTYQFFVLEFSTNQTATPAAPGRLLRYDTPVPQVVASDLRAPTSLAYDAATRELYVLELSGRILKLQLGEE